MITTLVMYICTTAAMDSCQVHAWEQWTDDHQTYECQASLEPALDELRRKGYPYVAAYCEEGEE